ncbi:MAG: PIG-L family deacetylase [Vicinamibacterales bacterium]
MIRRTLLRQIHDYVSTFIRPANLMSTPEVAPIPPGSRVLVLSPHFDDDVIGCGGALARHVAAGHTVTVVYLTDGREGDPSIPDKNQVSALRKDEARRATAILGITDLRYLDEPETKLRSHATLLERLGQIFGEVRPDLVYLPWFLDNHIDHFETNRILFDLAPRLDQTITVAAYEVWMPMVPSMVIDITSVAALKERALTQYETQIRHVDYVATTMGLNKYRSSFRFKGQGFAEAFFVTSLADYVTKVRALNLPDRVFISTR